MIVEPNDTRNFTDIEILALTLLGEARSLHAIGMEEAACTVVNRVAAKKWWGNTERAACLYPWQYSCWNENDPNRAKLLVWPRDDETYQQGMLIASTAMLGALDDITNGATHYFNHVTIPQPKWPPWYRSATSKCHINEPIWFYDLSEIG